MSIITTPATRKPLPVRRPTVPGFRARIVPRRRQDRRATRLTADLLRLLARANAVASELADRLHDSIEGYLPEPIVFAGENLHNVIDDLQGTIYNLGRSMSALSSCVIIQEAEIRRLSLMDAVEDALDRLADRLTKEVATVGYLTSDE